MIIVCFVVFEKCPFGEITGLLLYYISSTEVNLCHGISCFKIIIAREESSILSKKDAT